MQVSDLGEERFLQELAERYPRPEGVSLGIGDDAAALALPRDQELLLTTDALVEEIHFTRQTLPPRFLGRKAVAVNASDLAAMGGDGRAVLLSLVVPDSLDVQTLWDIVDGAAARASELGMSLVGGNLARSPSTIVVDATAVGSAPSGTALRRSGAQPGDALYVTGKLGASACGLALLKKGVTLSHDGGLVVPEALRGGPLALSEDCIRAHIDPEPRLETGRALRDSGLATACIDLSDGLSRDLDRLCRASETGAFVEESHFPVAPGALAWAREWNQDALGWAVSGGEDYELLFAARDAEAVDALRERSTVPITRIGELRPKGDGARVEIRRRPGSVEPLPPHGWDHFRR